MSQLAQPTSAPSNDGPSARVAGNALPGKGRARSHVRSTPLSSRGEPILWLTGMAMAISMIMIVALLAMTVYQGSRTFWVRPIETVTLTSGKTFMGMPTRDEPYDASPAVAAQIENMKQAGTLPADALDSDGRPMRRLYRIGNREVRGEPFMWASLHEISGVKLEPDAVLLERRDWGLWIGRPEAIVQLSTVTVPAGQAVPDQVIDERGRTVRQRIIGEAASKPGELPGGASAAAGQVVERQVVLSSGADVRKAISTMQPEAVRRFESVRSFTKSDIGSINSRLERSRLEAAQAEIDHRRTKAAQQGGDRPMNAAVWAGVVVLGIVGLIAGVVLSRKLARLSLTPLRASLPLRISCVAAWTVAILAMGAAVLERPWSGSNVTDEALAQIKQEHTQRSEALNAEYQQVIERIRAIEQDDLQYRVVVREIEQNRFAPTRKTAPDDPLALSSVVRWVQPNTMGFLDKVGVYFSRWREFIFDEPRMANTEGGIFPVIMGTVILTVLLSVVVVPLGVIAALYIREYAKQGPLISFVRICVNNLAGVPSIVYGVFGLGFFCYTLGVFVDRGPEPQVVAGRVNWWVGAVGLGVAVVVAAAAGMLSKPKPGQHATRRQKQLVLLGVLAWTAAAIGLVAMVWTTPYFHGFFEAKDAPTFGGRGILWGALTLALLTLPVVIVATEEAIAAVPRSMREGSYGCGATKWQTIQRIVLPRAMPGIMTGMILAMARGAGEVAPLMLVGAVKIAPDPPITGTFPYLHLDRSFMHLGFHIYDVGFQSPDSEAARPLVWTTTLVLVFIVLLLNLTAIRIRAQLRKKFVGGAF